MNGPARGKGTKEFLREGYSLTTTYSFVTILKTGYQK